VRISSEGHILIRNALKKQLIRSKQTQLAYFVEEKAKATLRKNELARIKKEAHDDRLAGRAGKYHKYQKKVIKGIQSVNNIGAEYNEIMGELKSLGGNQQAYSSGYAPKPKRSTKKGSKRKPQKTKSKSRNKKPDFWDQFM